MTTEQALFSQYRGKRILLDANLLLLFLIGSFDRSLISRFKRTSHFTENEYDILTNLIPLFCHLVTTPQLLTEVSSLANALPASIKPEWNFHLRQHTAAFFEVLTPSIELMQHPIFLSFGLADASIFGVASQTLVLTEDFRLAGFLRSLKLPVLNFRDLLALTN